MAEIDDFDLDRSTAQAWAEFTGRLAEVISMIDESADLTIRSFSASDGPAVRPALQSRTVDDPGRGRGQLQPGSPAIS